MKCKDCGIEFEAYQWNQVRCYSCIAKTDKRFQGKPKKICPVCGKEFQPRTIRQTYCTDDCGKHGWNRGYFKRTYNISENEYDELFERQDHRCAICGENGFKINSNATKTLCVDHDHITGRIRGLLCHNCNRALGLLQDSKDNLNSAIKYLQGSETIRKE